MATANVPFSSTPHAVALARILHVTRSAWALELDPMPATTTRAAARAVTQAATPALSRRARLARAAARAFEAQVMAIRCRQAVVA
ncbi:conserved protein of unknown function (plasmid) [Cupriavidus taiwanensis]|uniref:Uncharacterized protein n=1 Tax=Cupriavidus taiwanensis TaxID=164546 RepID=A0A375IRC6_9BURK|nr:hypothetical protein [Cupriavidus taiwanensis]SOZ74252.1 conserved hypothetical protein [Cupriavidus taiwanensis]SOZ88067.1 conserved hypothetical protein [Cupriavidus taiwanensis]SOZ95212.1 conserved hypothetical protein [Cupriavidus taiwanensis]SPA52089.1 conserved hypothetical protein [Cupriavidus taiwanensis]SPK76169.1 conserved protein of unknown function [Cupriavidus taiwanensis]